MRLLNKKGLFIKAGFLFIIAFISLYFIFPKSSSAAESVILSAPNAECQGSTAKFSLSWTSSITGTPTFFILRKAQGDLSFVQIGQTQNYTFVDSDVNLVSDKLYVYQIRAERSPDIFFSNESTSGAAHCAAAISSPQAVCQSTGPFINLTWTAASGTLLPYEIYRDGVKIGETSNASFSDGPNIEGTRTYNYFIKTRWQDGASANSDTAPVVALACAPVLNTSIACAGSSPGGPQVSLSWNSLLGVQNYQVYRKAQAETEYSLLATITNNYYTDSLVQSLSTYYLDGDVSYYVKAVWPTDQKDSNISAKTIIRCAPFLKVDSNCDGGPSMRLSWTVTMNATHYNIYRDGSFLCQTGSPMCPNQTSAIDYLTEQITTHTYYVEAAVTGLPNTPSNSATRSIDCTIIIPPSPAPVLDPLYAYCSSGDSIINVSWTPSDNVINYTIHRIAQDGAQFSLNLLENFYTDSAIQNNQNYTYYIEAVGQGGGSVISNSQTITSVSCTPPSASTVSATTICDNGRPIVNLSWTATTNTKSYEIWRGPSLANLSLLMTFNEGSPEFSVGRWKDTSVSVSSLYYYRVVSKGPPGVNSTNSTNTPSITTLSCVPATPALTIGASCPSNIPAANLSWTTNNANTFRFDIFRQDFSLTTPIKQLFGTSTLFWQDKPLNPLTTYNYKVVAVGYLDSITATQGYKPVTTYNCSAPGSFILNDPSVYCQGSYPNSDVSWTSSENATSYDLLRNQLNADDTIYQTTTLTGVASVYKEKGFSKALNFSRSQYDRVTVTNSPSLQIAGDMTISFWAYPTNMAAGRQNPLAKAYGGEFGLTMETNGTMYLYQGSAGGNGSPYMYCSAPNIFSNNNWINVTIVRNVAARTIVFYKNGVAQTTSCAAWVNPSASTRNLIIGYEWAGAWQGMLDQIRIYNRAISSAEVASVFGGSPSETGLAGIWNFDEGSGQIASDGSNFGNNGTLGTDSSVQTSDPDWTTNGIQSTTKYSWQARANSAGGSVLSNVSSSKLVPICQPSKPGLVLTPFCTSDLSTVQLKWSFSTNATSYEIYRQDKGATPIKTITSADPEFATRTWNDNNENLGLTQNASYVYYIKAFGPAGNNQSDSITVIAANCNAPSQPLNLTLTFSCSGSSPRINLTWDASANISYYMVYRSPSGTPFPVTTVTNSYLDTNITTATNYSYYVVAYGPGGSSLPSETKTLLSGYCPPTAVTINALPTNCEGSNSANTLIWTDTTEFDVDAYKIYRKTSDIAPVSPPDSQVTTINRGSPEFTDKVWKDASGLNTSTTYYYWVVSAGQAGYATSTSKSATTYRCGITPGTPTLGGGAPYCENNIPYANFSWNPSANAYSYNLYRTNPNNSTSLYPTQISPLSDKGTFSLNFDGLNSYAVVPNSASLNPKYATIEAWVYPTGFNDTGYIVHKYYSTNQYILRFYGYSGVVQGYFGFSGNIWRSCVTTATVPLNQWSHVASTYDGRYIKVYINGVLGCTTEYRGEIQSGTENFRIGSYYTSSSGTYRFKGLMDEVRLYGRALSQAELTEHYNGIYKNEADLRGVWHFDEGTDNAINDDSGNGNNGTIYSGTWQSTGPNVTKILPLVGSSVYKYILKAVGSGIESSASNEIQFTTPSCLPLKQTVLITSTCSDTDPQINLNWQNDANTLRWDLYRRRVSESFEKIADIYQPQISFTDSGIESGITYEYYLDAIGSGAHTESDIVSEQAEACLSEPTKPVTTSAPVCYGYSSRILTTWQEDESGNTISYNIYRKAGSEIDFSVLYSGLSSYANQYADTVEESNQFQYRVEAVGSGENNTMMSDPSDIVTSLPCSTMPPSPANLYISSVPYSTGDYIAVFLAWTDSGNEDYYRLFRRVSGTSEWTEVNSHDFPIPENEDPTAIIGWTDSTVTDNMDYEYQIISYNNNGQTASNILAIHVPTARPGALTLAGEWVERIIHLSWDPGSRTTTAGGEVKYTLIRDDTINFQTSYICTDISQTECDDSSPNISERFYKVVASNNGGATDSNIIYMTSMPVKWKETFPWSF